MQSFMLLAIIIPEKNNIEFYSHEILAKLVEHEM